MLGVRRTGRHSRIDNCLYTLDCLSHVQRPADVGLFLALAVLWGLSFPAIAVGLEYLPPLLFAAFRYDVAALLLLGYAAVRTDGWIPRGRDNLLAVVGGGLFLVAGNGLLFIGQQTVPSGVAAILTALIPLVTAVWAYLLLGERLSPTGTLGVAVGLVGIGFIVQPDPSNLLAGDTVGRLLILGQVASVSLGGVLVQRANPTIDTVPLTGWSMLLGGLVLHGASLTAREVPGPEAASLEAVAVVVYLAVFSTAIAFFIYFTVLAAYGAFQVALIQYLVPVVATLVGVFVLGESITPLTYVGFALIVAGFALVKRRAIATVLEGRLGASP